MVDVFVPQHFHLMFKGSPQSTFTDPEIAKQMLIEMVSTVGMVPVTAPQASYVSTPGNEGLTGSINLATSHIAFHCWDNTPLLQFDLYSCCSFNIEAVMHVLNKYYSSFSSYKYRLIDRMTFDVIEASENIGQVYR